MNAWCNIKTFIKKIRRLVALNWFRIKLAQQCQGLVNFLLLIVATSDKFRDLLGMRNTTETVAILFVSVFLGLMLIGFLYDKSKLYDEETRIQTERYPNFIELRQEIAELSKKIERLAQNDMQKMRSER